MEGPSSGSGRYIKARSPALTSVMKQGSLDTNPSTSRTTSVKRTVSRKIRRESSGVGTTGRTGRRPSAAADFWANFNYVDVIGTSGDDHHRHGHRQHRSRHAHPHRHHSDKSSGQHRKSSDKSGSEDRSHDKNRSTSRTKSTVRSSTMERESSLVVGDAGSGISLEYRDRGDLRDYDDDTSRRRKPSVMTAFSTSPGDDITIDSAVIKQVPEEEPSATHHHHRQYHHQETSVKTSREKMLKKQMSLDQKSSQVCRHHHRHHYREEDVFRRRSSSATAAGVTSLDSFEPEEEEDEIRGVKGRKSGHESFIIMTDQSKILTDRVDTRLLFDEDSEDIVQIIEVDDDRVKRRKKRSREDQVIEELQEELQEEEQEEEEEPFDPNRPYPEFADMSFNCIHQTSPIRQICIRMIMNPYPTAR